MAYEGWFWLHVNESEHISKADSGGERGAKNRRKQAPLGEKSASKRCCGKLSFRTQIQPQFDAGAGTSKKDTLASETRAILEQNRTDSGLESELTSSNPEE